MHIKRKSNGARHEVSKKGYRMYEIFSPNIKSVVVVINIVIVTFVQTSQPLPPLMITKTLTA